MFGSRKGYLVHSITVKSSPGHYKWFQEQSGFLREEITDSLSPLLDNADFYSLIQEALAATKRESSTPIKNLPPWHLLPLIVCQAISGDYRTALPAAASRMLLLAAADIFDDLEDADSEDAFSTKYGPAVTINAATALIFLAEKTAARLKDKGISSKNTLKIIELLNSTYIDACSGQYSDLTMNLNKDVSEDDYFKMISLKSASQLEYACRIGALSAGADRGITEKMGLFGHEIGMVTQIANDIQGIIRGNDIINRKLTLPVIFACSQKSPGYEQLKTYYEKGISNITDPAPLRHILFSTGAVQYSLVIMEEYKQRAKNILDQAGKSGLHTGRLKLFLG